MRVFADMKSFHGQNNACAGEAGSVNNGLRRGRRFGHLHACSKTIRLIGKVYRKTQGRCQND